MRPPIVVSCMSIAVITIRLDPYIHVGPFTIAWHGLTIAIGIVIGSLAAGRGVRERGLGVDPLFTIVGLLALGGLLGVVWAAFDGHELQVLDRTGQALGGL
jgi:prolipoprotein diacylglyceryltransferase